MLNKLNENEITLFPAAIWMHWIGREVGDGRPASRWRAGDREDEGRGGGTTAGAAAEADGGVERTDVVLRAGLHTAGRWRDDAQGDLLNSQQPLPGTRWFHEDVVLYSARFTKISLHVTAVD